VNACVHTYTKPQTSSTRSRGLGRRIHGSVEDTKLSTNKQHSLKFQTRVFFPWSFSTVFFHGLFPRLVLWSLGPHTPCAHSLVQAAQEGRARASLHVASAGPRAAQGILLSGGPGDPADNREQVVSARTNKRHHHPKARVVPPATA
jgi:hypothetical protein